jgi:hypothetical protein
MVTDRLKHFHSITPGTLKTAISCLKGYEVHIQFSKGLDPFYFEFPETVKFIDSILPFLAELDELHGVALLMKEQILREENHSKEAIEVFQQANELTSRVADLAELHHEQCLLTCASAYFALRDWKAAGQAYRQAVAFRWYSLRDRNLQTEFRDLSLQAGRAMLGFTEGDVEKLEGLGFLREFAELREEYDAQLARARQNSQAP